jgi:mono/diheme cytochrome c family protein
MIPPILRPHAPALTLLVAFAVTAGSIGVAAARAGTQDDGWQIGDDAMELRNPIVATPAVVTRGGTVYRSKCQRCHGRGGRGNGPDADPDDPPGDLTDARRAARNPDGVLFYKIWNGRRNPRMPAFKTEMSREEVWATVAYIKTLRVP